MDPILVEYEQLGDAQLVVLNYEQLFTKLAYMQPLPHQSRVAENLQDPEVHGQLLYHGLGSGKTFTSINAAKRLNKPIVAIVPAPLRNNYKKELAKANFKLPTMVLSYQEALNKKDDPEFQAFCKNSLVVYDEAHRMGEATSQRSQLPQLIHGDKTLLLTGTPIRNSPEEIVPLINAASPGTFSSDPEAFKRKYIHTREVPVGFWGRMRGVKPGKEKVPINLTHFEKAVKGKVDFYESANREDYPSFDEKIIEVPMSERQKATYDFTMGKYPVLAFKIKHGLPLDKNETANFQSFMIGPRQVANTPKPFNRSATTMDAPKIHVMAHEVEKRYKKDKNFRALVYSNFLDAGVRPMEHELNRRGIPTQTFTGEIGDKERKEIVHNYNAGKKPVLLISGAGAEGLDLKGTRLVQLMEPHWQNELLEQIKGRGIRYKSHSHLPLKDRHVEVQRFHSIPKATLWDRLLGRKRSPDLAADEYLYNLSAKKQELNNAFLARLKGPQNTDMMLPLTKAAAFEAEEWVRYHPTYDEKSPGLLIDLDGTIVEAPNGWPKELGQQYVLANRHDVLRRCKEAGFVIIGVTNRAVYPGDEESFTVEDVQSINEETMELFGDLLTDIIYIPYGKSIHHKPAPTMLNYALTNHNLDVNCSIFVGDSEDDREAAFNAGIPFVPAEEFFA